MFVAFRVTHALLVNKRYVVCDRYRIRIIPCNPVWLPCKSACTEQALWCFPQSIRKLFLVIWYNSVPFKRCSVRLPRSRQKDVLALIHLCTLNTSKSRLISHRCRACEPGSESQTRWRDALRERCQWTHAHCLGSPSTSSNALRQSLPNPKL